MVATPKVTRPPASETWEGGVRRGRGSWRDAEERVDAAGLADSGRTASASMWRRRRCSRAVAPEAPPPGKLRRPRRCSSAARRRESAGPAPGRGPEARRGRRRGHSARCCGPGGPRRGGVRAVAKGDAVEREAVEDEVVLRRGGPVGRAAPSLALPTQVPMKGGLASHPRPSPDEGSDELPGSPGELIYIPQSAADSGISGRVDLYTADGCGLRDRRAS